MPIISSTSRKLLTTFDEAAQAHGWERDQGSMGGADRAKKAYEEAKAAIERRIRTLEMARVERDGLRRTRGPSELAKRALTSPTIAVDLNGEMVTVDNPFYRRGAA